MSERKQATRLAKEATRDPFKDADPLYIVSRELLRAVETDWRTDIENAPKDGTTIYIWDGLGVSLASWWVPETDDDDFEFGTAEPAWLVRGSDDFEFIHEPTHWAPYHVPSPPPGSSWSNAILYRGYRIHLNDCNIHVSVDWVFSHEDFDGAEDAHDGRCGCGPSVEACKREIDEQIVERGE